MKKLNLSSCCPELHHLASTHFFRALSDENRLLLLWRLLTDGTTTLTVLASEMSVDVSVVSRHLALLRTSGLVQAEKDGREVHFSVDTQKLSQILRNLANFIDQIKPPKSPKRKTLGK